MVNIKFEKDIAKRLSIAMNNFNAYMKEFGMVLYPCLNNAETTKLFFPEKTTAITVMGKYISKKRAPALGECMIIQNDKLIHNFVYGLIDEMVKSGIIYLLNNSEIDFSDSEYTKNTSNNVYMITNMIKYRDIFIKSLRKLVSEKTTDKYYLVQASKALTDIRSIDGEYSNYTINVRYEPQNIESF